MDKFWWMCSTRSMACVQSWHSFDNPHRHLLLMIDFDYPLAFRHKKGGVHLGFETLVEVFVFRGRFFLSLELVEIRLYLGASLCIYLFLALDVFLLGYSF